MKRQREHEEEEKPVIKKNKLLNPLIYEQWKEVNRTFETVEYESPQHIGISVYSDHADESAFKTHILSKKTEDGKGLLRVKKTMEGMTIFDGKIHITPNISKEYPLDVRTSIIQLARDVIGACSCDPKSMAAQNAVREILEEGETHYLYAIEYTESDAVLTLPIPTPSSTTSPLASAIELISMQDGKMTFTFCVKNNK